MWMLAAVAVLLMLVALNVTLWPRIRTDADGPGEPVSVLIPARNEEARLPATLEAVLGQPCVGEVLVYDDHSSDGTAQVVERYARLDPRVRRIPPLPLPSGWCGKTFACHTLAQNAAFPWLLFLDADSILAPAAVGRILAEALGRNVTLLSCWPRLEMQSFCERLLMPVLNFVVFSLYPAPLALRRRDDPSLGLAHGALILASREAYRRVGGHAAVRDELFEDTMLARVWRRAGEVSLCLDGQDVVRTRMYEGLGQIWRGFQKNFRPAFHSAVSFWLFLTLHAVLFLGPFLALHAAAAGCVLGMRLLLALRFRHPLWSCLLHPVAEVFLLALGLASWWRASRGGVEWKGRRYAKL